jgi:peroxiredoxin-like protein
VAGHDHHYYVTCRWSGSTGAGYEDYERRHEVAVSPAEAVLEMSSDPEFRGDPSLVNPEQLVLAAASSCQLLSFLAVAARARIDVVDYTDEGEAVMADDDPPLRITTIELRPLITIRAEEGELERSRLERLVQVAHEECFVARSLRSEVRVEPAFRFVPPGPGS